MTETRSTIVRLLSNMASAKEIQLYLKRFSQLDAARFAVVKVGGAILRDDLEALVSSLSFLQQGSQGFPIAYSQTVAGPTGIGTMTTVSFTCGTGCAQQGNDTPLFNYADTLSYTKGKHTFKGGVDVRMTYTKGYETPTAPIPKAFGGGGLNPTQVFSNNPAMPGLTSNNQTTANNLLYFMAGSLDRAQQYYHLYSPTDLKWGN